MRLAPALSAEVVFLGVVTLYSLTLALRSSLTLIDSVVLVGVFAAHVAVGQPVQFSLHQRQELFESSLVSIAPVDKQTGDFIGGPSLSGIAFSL